MIEKVYSTNQGGSASQAISNPSNANDELLAGVDISAITGRKEGSIVKPVQPGAEPLDTIRTADGRVPDTIAMDSRITIAGIEMTVGSALKAGLIKHSDVGMAPDGPKTQLEAMQQQLQEALNSDAGEKTEKPAEALVKFEQDHEDVIQDIFDTLGPKVALNHVQHIIYAGNRDAAVGNLASDMGVLPGEAISDVNAIIADGEAKAAQYISNKFGIDGKDVIEFGRDLPKALVNEAALRFFNGDYSGLGRIVQEYQKAKGKSSGSSG
jgi:hypothetical protein